MVNNDNTAPQRSLRDGPPLSSGLRNPGLTTVTNRRRSRAPSASSVQRDAHMRPRQREPRRNIDKRYQHMKGSARMRATTKNSHTATAQTPVNDTSFARAAFVGGNTGLAIDNLHGDPLMANNTLTNSAHTAGFLEHRTALSTDPFVASEMVSADLPRSISPLQNMYRDTALLNALLLESLRVAEYLQRHTVSDSQPYRPSEPVALYLEHLRVNHPEALMRGRVEVQDSSVTQLGGVGFGESVMSPPVGPHGSEDAGRADESDFDGYTSDWQEEMAQGSVWGVTPPA